MDINDLKIKTIKYGKTNIFTLNKYNFEWRELNKFEDLTNILLSNKYQKNINFKKYKSNEPCVVLNNDDFSSNDIFFEKPILLMNICLPCYDEEWCEISGTLRSLSKNILICRNRPDNHFQLHVNIFLIQDGWNKASKTFKEGVVKEWGCPSKEMIDKTLSKDIISIIIPDNEIFYPSYQYLNKEEKSSLGVTFHPIFITKKRNAQKYNSHLLFFSLCNLQNPDFVFLTDCGTVFNSDCIFQLSEYLYKKHSSVIGVTAKQSVMNETMRRQIQEYPDWWKNKNRQSFCTRFFNNIYWWLSPAPLQGFEFESSFLLNTSMFNIAGALPVLPGPCQMLWWEHLQKDNGQMGNGVLDVYFKHINESKKESTTNIIKINTVLAEDRILSFAMILRTFDLKTVWVNKASFSYEPMMTWVNLLGQRRRWINGTISTFIYYLFDEKGVDEYSMSGLGNRKSIKYLWFIQLYQSLLQILSPSFFAIAVFESFLQFFKTFPFLRKFMSMFQYNTTIYNFSIEMAATGCYLLFYIFWVIISFLFGKRNDCCCSKKCYNFVMEVIYLLFSLINAIISIFIFFNIFSANDKMFIFGPLIYILMFIWIVPFFLSLSLSVDSAFYYIIYSLPFFVNISQYVSFVPIFAFSRLHDLSWGNRDSKTDVGSKTKISFLFTTIKLNLLVIFLNISITMIYVYLITFFGHNEYVYSIFFLVLFLSVIIQIFFTIMYFCKLLCKGCRKQCCFTKNDDFEICSSDNNNNNNNNNNAVTIKSVNSSVII